MIQLLYDKESICIKLLNVLYRRDVADARYGVLRFFLMALFLEASWISKSVLDKNHEIIVEYRMKVETF